VAKPLFLASASFEECLVRWKDVKLFLVGRGRYFESRKKLALLIFPSSSHVNVGTGRKNRGPKTQEL
jgi:hypothetical protein